jgi:phytoene/squalene synthetase
MSSMSNYEVRPAKLSDAKAIAEIHASSSRAAFKALFPGEQSPAVPADMGLAYWRDAIEFSEPQVFVAIDAPGRWSVLLALTDHVTRRHA